MQVDKGPKVSHKTGNGTKCSEQFPDESFWQVQVHAPTLAWIAAGFHGVTRTPAEQLASGHMQGGLNAITPVVESYQGTKGNPTGEPRRRKLPIGGREVQALEKI